MLTVIILGSNTGIKGEISRSFYGKIQFLQATTCKFDSCVLLTVEKCRKTQREDKAKTQ